ncbi:MAG: hypothetical protein HY963_07280 [Ignavibacteriales bacterium]|nr:hypothetical protein [Ignavibacteriales bacterium]
MRLIKKLILFTVFIYCGTALNAQSFGFGCLGLSGFYAGFSKQNYDNPGLNDYIRQRINILDPSKTIISDKIEFTQGTGYRIGANFFRAKWDKFFISAKGYYQFLKESNEISAQLQNVDTREKYQLTMNHWGVGIDLGVPLFWILDWKIAEANVTFYNTEFSQETFLNNVSQGEIKFKPDKNNIGYFIGTGLILHLVPDYISVEGTAGFNIIQIDDLSNDSGITIPSASSSKKVIDKGNLSITLQLNVGFPL